VQYIRVLVPIPYVLGCKSLCIAG